jgi:hypothetical protein
MNRWVDIAMMIYSVLIFSVFFAIYLGLTAPFLIYDLLVTLRLKQVEFYVQRYHKGHREEGKDG